MIAGTPGADGARKAPPTFAAKGLAAAAKPANRYTVNSSIMYSLDQDLARRRLLYPRPLLTLPDVLLIDLPARFAGDTLPLGRYYPIIVETERERVELDHYLTAERAAPIVPDLFDHRSSQLSCDRVTIATYEPPVAGWPFLLLCHWPARYTVMVRDKSFFARGAYTSELFDTLGELTAASTRLLAVLGRNLALDVILLAPHTQPLGRA